MRLLRLILSSLRQLLKKLNAATVYRQYLDSLERGFSTAAAIFATGTPAVGATQASPSYPAVTITAGMGIIIQVSSKLQTTRPIPPAGFRRLPYGWGIAGTTSNGGDIGPVGQTIMYKVAEGGESGSVLIDTINGSAGNGIIQATIFVISKDADADLEVECVWGCHNVPNVTAYSARSGRKSNTKRGDKWLVLNSVNVDSTNADSTKWTAEALAITGATIETTTQEIFESGNATGNDLEQFGSLFTITDGNVTDYLTATATASVAAAGNPIGITHFIRIRQKRNVQQFRSSALNVYAASHTPDDTVSATFGMGTGLMVDFESINNVSVDTYLGEPVFMLDADFRLCLIDGDPILRRQEIKSVPDKPAFPEGTITNWGFKYHTLNLLEPKRQVIFMQAHTGSFGTTPHHPITYFEVLADSQNPINNGGILNIAYGMSALDTGVENSVRTYIQPQINGQYINMLGTQTHYFKCEQKWHRTTGYLMVWYKNGDMDDYELIVNATGIKTMADTSPELGSGVAGTGATPLVGPHIKVGPYCHQVSTFAHVVDNRTAPYAHDRFLMMCPGLLIIETLPTESDIADRTKARQDTDPDINWLAA